MGRNEGGIFLRAIPSNAQQQAYPASVALWTVNERQLAVLKWISEGCPPGVWADDSYKASVAALRSRRLVKITKGRGHWSAEVTEAGAHFLEAGAYPEGHWADRGGPRAAKRPQGGSALSIRGEGDAGEGRAPGQEAGAALAP